MFEIETERLLLRDILKGDENRLVSYFAEGDAQPYLLHAQRIPKRVRSFVRSAVNPQPLTHRSSFHLAIEVKETRELVGICTLKFAEPGSINALLGWHICSAHSGKGYATESGRALLEMAFNTSDVRRVNSDCFEHNQRARNVLSKLCMRQQTTSRLAKWWMSFSYGEDRSIVRYCIDAAVWKELSQHQ